MNGIRPSGYTAHNFSSDFAAYAAALSAAAVPVRSLQAPTTQGASASWNATWYAGFVAQFAAQGVLSSVASHYYPTSVCGLTRSSPQWPTPAMLLSETRQATTLTRLVPQIAAAATAGLPFHIGEGSGVCCAGANGTADAMPVALWAVDALFSLAAMGVSRFNFHGGPYGGPIGDNSAVRFLITGSNPVRYATQPLVTPLFYGLAAFTAATAHDARLVRVSNVTSPAGVAVAFVKCWAVVDALGSARVVLVNKDVNAAAPVNGRITVRDGTGGMTGDARVAALLPGAAGLASTSGITFAGLSFDGTIDGTPSGVYTETDVPITTPGVYDLVLQPFSALVVTLPTAGAHDSPSPPPPAPGSVAAGLRPFMGACILLAALASAVAA